jgi:hypothetical protein
VFSLTRLVENTQIINAHLSPGMCPYKHVVSIKQNYQIQELFRNTIEKIDKVYGTLNVVYSTDDDIQPDENLLVDGFKKFNRSPNFSDQWF